MIFMPGNVFSPVPLHRDYLLRLCARDGIASSIIIIIRRFASSLFAGCGWLWWVLALTHALHRPSSTPSCGRFWGFWDEFGAPPFFLRSATTDAFLPSSPVTFLLLFAGSLFIGSSTGAIGPGRSRSINSSRSFPPTQLGNTHLSFDSFRRKKRVRFLRFLAGCFSDLVEGPAG